MSFLTRHLNQRATLWTVSSIDSSGDPTFTAAKAINVRWEDRQAVFTSPTGEEASASAVVFMAEDVAPGDYLFLGTSSVANPTTVVGAREIQGFSKIPQLTGSDFERRAFLKPRS